MASRFSDSSLDCVAALVRWHLPARSLVRFKLVNKEWETWISQNLRELAKVRKQTLSDWYFPITMSYGEGRAGAEVKPLAAIHHPSDEEHKLPDLDYLPNWRGGRSNPYDIQAVSGGLFLFNFYSSELRSCDLYVVNPLTRKWRKLSRRNCCQKLRWDLLHAQMVVDENVGAYTVIVLTDNCINVYSSHSNHWVCNPVRYSTGFLNPGFPHFGITSMSQSRFPASACADGYVYVYSGICEECPGRSVVEIQMFPIQPVAEQHPTRSPTIVALGDFRANDIFFGCVHPIASLKLVECMGSIYIVACRCEMFDLPQNTVSGVLAVVMRRVIHIFKFQEGSKICPLHVHYVSERKLLGRAIFSVLWMRRDNISCTAKSSVIWVAWDNHLLQYDVVSSVWKDGYHSIDSFSSEDDKLLNQDYDLSPSAYTPCFDLSP